MAKRKRKLTASEKLAKAERNARFEIIFIGGKQKRVLRPTDETVGMSDPIWLLQNEMWPELLEYERRCDGVEDNEVDNPEPQ